MFFCSSAKNLVKLKSSWLLRSTFRFLLTLIKLPLFFGALIMSSHNLYFHSFFNVRVFFAKLELKSDFKWLSTHIHLSLKFIIPFMAILLKANWFVDVESYWINWICHSRNELQLKWSENENRTLGIYLHINLKLLINYKLISFCKTMKLN